MTLKLYFFTEILCLG